MNELLLCLGLSMYAGLPGNAEVSFVERRKRRFEPGVRWRDEIIGRAVNGELLPKMFGIGMPLYWL